MTLSGWECSSECESASDGGGGGGGGLIAETFTRLQSTCAASTRVSTHTCTAKLGKRTAVAERVRVRVLDRVPVRVLVIDGKKPGMRVLVELAVIAGVRLLVDADDGEADTGGVRLPLEELVSENVSEEEGVAA